MEPHSWNRVQEVYYLALAVSPDQRHDFVGRACDFDPLLTHEICSLLKANDSSTGFLESPVFGLGLRILSGNGPAQSSEKPQPADELIGSTIDQRYEVEYNLAKGGMARVYLARDLRLHRKRVVVKVLLDESLRNERILRKFLQEQEALARINHPGVVSIFDARELADKKPYIVMQYVEGISLREAIAAKPEGMEFERAASIITGIGAALKAVHEEEIYHRDLKPENIMLQRPGAADERVIVVDFGIAKVKGSLIAPSTMTGAGTMGTVAYMSPEQLRGDKVTAASDLYSFSVIAYEILTGRRPFVADTPADLFEMQREGVRVKPKDLRRRLTVEAQSIILRALAFKARDRGPGVKEFGDSLSRALLADEDVELEHSATPVMPTEAAVASGSPTAVDPVQPSVSVAGAQTQEANLTGDGKSRPRRWLMFTVGAVLLIAGVTGGYWLVSRSGLLSKPLNSRSTSLPHRALTYSLTVQKMRGGLPYQDPYESSGQETFENGDKFRLNVFSRQAGYLYVFNEWPTEKYQTSFTIIYPTPATKEGSARLEQNENMQTNWNTFSGTTGTELFWIVWSESEVTPLEIARHEAFKHKEGAVTEAPTVRSLRAFLAEHSNPEPESSNDTAKPRTSVRAGGDLLVKRLPFEHR